jgi:hypothetical protein
MDDFQKQIRYALRRYLSGQVSFEAFEDWFVDATWDVSQDHPDATALVFAVESHISDYTSGQVNERQFKRRVRPLAPAAPGWSEAVDAIPAVPTTKPANRRSKPKMGATMEVAAAGT